MACEKSELLALLRAIERDVEACDTRECAVGVLRTYRRKIEELAISDVLSSLF